MKCCVETAQRQQGTFKTFRYTDPWVMWCCGPVHAGSALPGHVGVELPCGDCSAPASALLAAGRCDCLTSADAPYCRLQDDNGTGGLLDTLGPACYFAELALLPVPATHGLSKQVWSSCLETCLTGAVLVVLALLPVPSARGPTASASRCSATAWRSCSVGAALAELALLPVPSAHGLSKQVRLDCR